MNIAYSEIGRFGTIIHDSEKGRYAAHSNAHSIFGFLVSVDPEGSPIALCDHRWHLGEFSFYQTFHAFSFACSRENPDEIRTRDPQKVPKSQLARLSTLSNVLHRPRAFNL